MMKSVVLTFYSLLILHSSNVFGIRIPQEQCEYYQDNEVANSKDPTKRYPFIVKLSDNFNGVLISENFVLTIANNESAEYFVVLGNSEQKIEVIEKIPNEHQNIELLKLSESVEFSDYVRPICLPQPQSVISFQLTEICWVANSWLNEMKLKIVSNSSCSKNSGNYNKSLRIQGVEDETNFCADVQTGDRDLCHKPGATLLNDKQELVGIATKFVNGSPQVFVRVSDYVSWIEMVVWPNPEPAKSSTPPTNNKRTTTPNPNIDTIILSQIDDELHEIHTFLNVNLILIVLILFFVLCISCILWSDGLCIRAILPDKANDRCSTPTSTSV